MSKSSTEASPPSFGMVKGVLVPNITMMFGVILFLRLGVVTAHSGPYLILAAIGLSLLIMTLTSFSIGSLVTNMRVGAGGAYYIISRLLGLEFGGAIGIVLYFAQLSSIALTVSGFALSVTEFIPSLSITALELLTLALLSLLAGASASWTLRLQGAILVLLLAAIASVLGGSPANLAGHAVGEPFFEGGSLGFWVTFAMFYPAMTGIEAGMAMSGSLKDPSSSLFRGNLYSLIFVAVCYAGLALFSWWRVPHEVLLSDPFALVDFAWSSALVRAGIWGATLSSAIGSLLAAPRMLQAMALDGIIWEPLGRAHGSREEPRLANAFTFVLAAALMVATTIDQVIPMLALICLICYGLLNFVAAFAELMNSPSWRPSIRMPWTLSLAAVACILVVMLLMAPGWSLLTLTLLVAVYISLRARDLESGFHDLRESFLFFISRLLVYRLSAPTRHALTWHPQLLVLMTAPTQVPNIVHLAAGLTRRSGILSFAALVPEDWKNPEKLSSTKQTLDDYFERQQIACLTEVHPSDDTISGYADLIRAYGIGPIQPNSVLLEFNESLLDGSMSDLINTCRLTQKNVLLVKDAAATLLKGFGSKRIDIWWDSDDPANFELTLSLVTTLTDGRKFRGAPVTIKTMVSDENARSQVEAYLREYMKTSRIKAQVRVYTRELDAQRGPYPCDAQGPATLTAVSLAPIPDEPNAQESAEYSDYLQQLFRDIHHLKLVLLVGNYDQVDHRSIYVDSPDLV